MTAQPPGDDFGGDECETETITRAHQYHSCWLYAPEVSWAGEMVFAECVPTRYLHEFTNREACKRCRLEAYQKQERRQARKLKWQSRWETVRAYFEGSESSASSIRRRNSKIMCGSEETLTPSTLTRSGSWESGTTATTDSTGEKHGSVSSRSSSSTKGGKWSVRKAHTAPVGELKLKQERSKRLEESGQARRAYTDVFQPGPNGLLDWRIVLAASGIF